ncbi:hypothetical protein PG985_010263 [Apiospora marii]|uniref:uncharacterized protein n=1 Tax=Apiospora marii TaxID=335849 RepID=UPI00312E9F84
MDSRAGWMVVDRLDQDWEGLQAHDGGTGGSVSLLNPRLGATLIDPPRIRHPPLQIPHVLFRLWLRLQLCNPHHRQEYVRSHGIVQTVPIVVFDTLRFFCRHSGQECNLLFATHLGLPPTPPRRHAHPRAVRPPAPPDLARARPVEVRLKEGCVIY